MSTESPLARDGGINRLWLNDRLTEITHETSNPLNDDDLNELTHIVADFLENHIVPD